MGRQADLACGSGIVRVKLWFCPMRSLIAPEARKSVHFARMSIACGLAASFAGVSPAHVRGVNRGRKFLYARAAALYLGHVALAIPLTEAARALGRDRASARRACAKLEERREAPAYDRAMNGLESALILFCAALPDAAPNAAEVRS